MFISLALAMLSAPAPRVSTLWLERDMGTLTSQGQLIDQTFQIPQYPGPQDTFLGVRFEMIVENAIPRVRFENTGDAPLFSYSVDVGLNFFLLADLQDPNGLSWPPFMPQGSIPLTVLGVGGTPCPFPLAAFDGSVDWEGPSGFTTSPPCFPMEPSITKAELYPRPEFVGRGTWPLRAWGQVYSTVYGYPGPYSNNPDASAHVVARIGYVNTAGIE